MNPELERELYEAVSGPGDVGPVLEKISQGYSTKLAEALNPIDRVSAPFVFFLLHQYAEVIAAHYPEAPALASHLRNCMKAVNIVIPVKRSDPK